MKKGINRKSINQYRLIFTYSLISVRMQIENKCFEMLTNDYSKEKIAKLKVACDVTVHT